MEVFVEDFSMHGTNFDHCLFNITKVLQRRENLNLVLNWENCHFMVLEGVVLVHIISDKGIKIDKEKV